MPAKKKAETSIDIIKLGKGTLDVCVLGTSPLIINRMSEKAKRELLLPRKKTASERASMLKHQPPDEFRASVYTDLDPRAPTLLQGLSTWFKGAMMEAALDIPDVTKSKIQRLVWVNGQRVSLYGIPKLFMSITRSSDMNRTPDVRTRAILEQWACRVSISFRTPLLREQAIANLFAASGVTPGVGDWRVGKNGSFGQFEIVGPNDPAFSHLVKHCGLKAQTQAMKTPEPYDEESAELLSWFHDEKDRRGFKDAPSDGNGKSVAIEVHA